MSDLMGRETGTSLTPDQQAAVDAVDTEPPWDALADFAAIIGAQSSIVIGASEWVSWQERMDSPTTVNITEPTTVEAPTWSA